MNFFFFLQQNLELKQMRSRAQLEKEEALKQLKEHLLKVGFANSTNNYNFEYFVTTIGS